MSGEVISGLTPHTAYFGLWNIRLETQLKIGRVRFCPAEPVLIEALEAEHEAFAGSIPNETARRLTSESLTRMLSRSTAFAAVETSRVGRAAVDEAKHLVRLGLDGLRFLCAGHFTSGVKPWFGVTGTLSRDRSMVLATGAETGRCVASFTNEGAMVAAHLSSELISGVEPQRLALDHAMNPRNSSDLYRKFLDALKWFADGLYEEEPHQRLVKHVVALETLTSSPDRRNEGSHTFGSRASLLFSDDVTVRRRARKIFAELYDIRSAIVHDGMVDVERERPWQAEELAHKTLLGFLSNSTTNGWKTFDDFADWCSQSTRPVAT